MKFIMTALSDIRLPETYLNISKTDERDSAATGTSAVKNHGLVTKGA